ncbi:hypothetical protein ACIBH1_25685 [Nonomuraea sp. NPDC050663]|uniref:hypothetical protein n=1 Tax=Nonomuraea sp. NPDC050663 TaxID=3364370 RepID=UPI00379AE619
MRKSIATLIGAALVAAPLTVTAPAQAQVAAPAAAPVTAAVARPPYSKFKISLTYDKKTTRGGKITYLLKAKNLGPHYANYYWIGGRVPKGVVKRLRWWTGPKTASTRCDWKGEWFWCWGPWALPVGETDVLQFQLTLDKKTRGPAVARLGVRSWDLPTGAHNLPEDELKRLGMTADDHYDLVSAKTTIIWPSPGRPTPRWVPPVTKNWKPPTPTKTEENKKKGT